MECLYFYSILPPFKKKRKERTFFFIGPISARANESQRRRHAVTDCSNVILQNVLCLSRPSFFRYDRQQTTTRKKKIWCRWRMFHKMGRNPAGYRALLSLSRFTSDQELRHFFFSLVDYMSRLGGGPHPSAIHHDDAVEKIFSFSFFLFYSNPFCSGSNDLTIPPPTPPLKKQHKKRRFATRCF
jgi:hypothetical protein